jgi:hypothetical protein
VSHLLHAGVLLVLVNRARTNDPTFLLRWPVPLTVVGVVVFLIRLGGVHGTNQGSGTINAGLGVTRTGWWGQESGVTVVDGEEANTPAWMEGRRIHGVAA